MAKSMNTADLSQENYDRLLATAYERYRLDWMLRQDCTITSMIQGMDEYLSESDPSDYTDQKDPVARLFADWEHEMGFACSTLWVCRGEFEGAEFQDEGYMQHLLNASDFRLWKAFQEQNE